MKKIIATIVIGVLWGMPARVSAVMTLGSLTVTRVAPRIITPNGDTFNDKARFEFDNPELLPVQGEVYDLSGARVAAGKRIATLGEHTRALLQEAGLSEQEIAAFSTAQVAAE